MRISLIAALAAATALVPVAASAQSRHDNGGWNRGDGNGRGDHRGGSHDRGAPAQLQAPARPQPHQWQNDRQAQRPTTNRDAGDFARPERPQPMAQRPAQGNWHAEVGNAQRDRGGFADRDRPQFEHRNSGNWHAEAGGQDRGDWRGDRNRDQGNWQQRPDARRDVNRSNQDWRDHNRDAYRNDRREAFNRDWRRDQRYDWRDYRARNRSAYHLPRYYAPYGWGYGYRRFGVGFTLDSVLFGSNYWISDPWAYRLPQAYGPYRWVRYYDDALLVDLRTGYVVDVVYDIFW